MTNADWEHAFHELLKSNLINVPPNYYEDKLHFSDPDTLTALFSKMEENNLQMIHNQQEQEQAYEALLSKENKVRTRAEVDYDDQNKTRLDLIRKIESSKLVLSSLMKKTTDGQLYEPVAGQTNAKGQPKMISVDFEGLLKKLRK